MGSGGPFRVPLRFHSFSITFRDCRAWGCQGLGLICILIFYATGSPCSCRVALV